MSRSDFGVSIRVPASWEADPSEDQQSALAMDGPNGFVLLYPGHTEFFEGADPVVAPCQHEASRGAHGSSPTVERTTIDGHDACVVRPSPDAQAWARRAGGAPFAPAMIVVFYETPVTGSNGNQYVDLVLYSDPNHQASFVASLEFLDGH